MLYQPTVRLHAIVSPVAKGLDDSLCVTGSSLHETFRQDVKQSLKFF